MKGRVFTPNWSDLIPVEVNKPAEVIINDTPQRKRTVKNIVLVPISQN